MKRDTKESQVVSDATGAVHLQQYLFQKAVGRRALGPSDAQSKIFSKVVALPRCHQLEIQIDIIQGLYRVTGMLSIQYQSIRIVRVQAPVQSSQLRIFISNISGRRVSGYRREKGGGIHCCLTAWRIDGSRQDMKNLTK
jgi:hypothetical protein